jgi:hypothetical protein
MIHSSQFLVFLFHHNDTFDGIRNLEQVFDQPSLCLVSQ